MANAKDHLIGSLTLALFGTVGVLYYGLQFERTTSQSVAHIAGELVVLRAYENRWFGGGVQICLQDTCYSRDAYLERLEMLLDQELLHTRK